jgi:hypothetical protein
MHRAIPAAIRPAGHVSGHAHRFGRRAWWRRPVTAGLAAPESATIQALDGFTFEAADRLASEASG